MKPGRVRQFPELYDREYLISTINLSDETLVRRFGCTPRWVYQRRQREGLSRMSRRKIHHWSVVETDLLRRLHGRVSLAFLSARFKRSRRTISYKAYREKISSRKTYGRPRLSAEEEWALWREALVELLPLWEEMGIAVMEIARRQMWRPPRHQIYGGCRKTWKDPGGSWRERLCPHYAWCDAHREELAFCEAVKVGDTWLQSAGSTAVGDGGV
jgi:hypothetical protein